ncbi:MAG TPA: type III secretion protein [Chromatiales bacterium]|nr:type III secretion protein [Chromatiales bacterium]
MARGRKRGRRAVALRYDGRGAPRVTAAGGGALAERIVAAAREHGVPLHEDPALAEALAAVPVGEEIPPELYVAVAEVLAFVFLVHGRGTDPGTAERGA